MDRPILIGAVAYNPCIVPIWDGMREYFQEAGLPIDYLLFSNYDRQVEALLAGRIDVAWSTNLAWVKIHKRTQGKCRALAMRDVDAAFTTIFVARTDSGIKTLADVRGKRLALGSADSGQAAILPVHFFQEAGVDPDTECTVLRFDLDVGKHGDTGTSQLEVLRALRDNQADAGALAESTWERELSAGRVDGQQIQPIWTSPGYCHCNFTVLDEFPEDVGKRWTELLLAMTYDQPRWRTLMDQEGLKQWLPANDAVMKGYDVLFDAVERQGLAANWS